MFTDKSLHGIGFHFSNKISNVTVERREMMSQLSEKELGAINELLNEEELLVKKFQMLAQQTKDPGIKKEFEAIAKKHQGHFNMLYEQLR